MRLRAHWKNAVYFGVTTDDPQRWQTIAALACINIRYVQDGNARALEVVNRFKSDMFGDQPSDVRNMTWQRVPPTDPAEAARVSRWKVEFDGHYAYSDCRMPKSGHLLVEMRDSWTEFGMTCCGRAWNNILQYPYSRHGGSRAPLFYHP